MVSVSDSQGSITAELLNNGGAKTPSGEFGPFAGFLAESTAFWQQAETPRTRIFGAFGAFWS